ncbi:MAG: hypothetical protein DWQ01_06670 [Planctomycetota bacterium]|nr:MAG: hypothetical protein DWQ01_06670 [Planctomycetota bacterium]
MGSFLARLAAWQTRRPWASASIGLALSLAALWGLPKLSLDPDFRSFFPSDNPTLQRLESAGASDESARSLLLLIEASPEELENRLQTLQRSPGVEAVHKQWKDLAGPELEALTETPLSLIPVQAWKDLDVRLQDAALDRAIEQTKTRMALDPLAGKRLALEDPLGLRWFLEDYRNQSAGAWPDPEAWMTLPSGRSMIRVLGQKSAYDLAFSEAILAQVESAMDGLEFQITGGYAAARSDSQRMRSDLQTTLSGSLSLVFLFLFLSTRSLWLPILWVVPTLFALLWTLGFAGFSLPPLSPLAISAAAVLLGLGVDFAIHYGSRYGKERQQLNHAQAVQITHRSTGPVLFAGMLTTACAFLSLLGASMPALRSFSALLAAGMVLCLISTFCWLPVFLAPVTPKKPRIGWVVSGFQRLRRRPQWARALAATLLIAASAGWGLVWYSGLELDCDPRRMRPAEDPLLQSQSQLETELGMAPMPVTIWLAKEQPLPKIRQQLETWQAEGWIAASRGPHWFVPSEAQAKAMEDFQNRNRNWQSRAVQRLQAHGFQTDPFLPALDRIQQQFFGRPAALLPTHLQTWQGKDYWQLELHPRQGLWEKAERREFHRRVQATFGPETLFANPYGLADQLEPILERDLFRGILWAAVAVVLWLLIFLRNIRDAVLALSPVAVAYGLLLGGMVWLQQPLTPGNFVALPFLLGLGVDDGIHMVARYREGRGDPLETTGLAIWRTSATTFLAFGSLVFAQSPQLSSLGWLLAVGIAVCLITSLGLLPTFLETHPKKNP